MINFTYMKSKRWAAIFFASILVTTTMLVGCNTIGMLLFYRDARTRTVYRSPGGKKNYFIIKATTLSHCGCTELFIANYKAGKRNFYISYNGNTARKTIFGYNEHTNKRDTLRLLATPYDNFTVAFDPLDVEIFNRIDSLSIHKPKGIVYSIMRTKYKGFIKEL